MATRTSKIDIDSIINTLEIEFDKHRMPVVDLIQAQTKDPFKVLIATILSARTKDQTTSIVVEKLFKKVKSFNDIDKVSEKEMQDLIYPVGFYKNKAQHLKKLPAVVKELYNGEIPQTVEELIKLPGVGRKTANLVVSVAFDKPAICVDIHVHRISNRIGYVKTKTPLDTEMTLRKKLPIEHWKAINKVMVSYGQNLCTPINPKCNKCPIHKYCRRIDVKTKYS